MKVSKKIRAKMQSAVKHFAEGQRLMHEVDDYLEKAGLDANELRCGDGCSLEEIEYGNDVVDEICFRIEQNGFGRNSHE